MRKRDKNASLLYLYGMHAVRAALANPRRKIHSLLFALPETHPNRQSLEDDLKEHPNPPHISETTLGHLDKLVGGSAVHQNVVALAKPLPNQDLSEFLNGFEAKLPDLALLDQVTDPHNVGAVLRSAAAFGIGGLITPSRHSPKESGLIARISSGGLEIVPWLRVRDLGDACEVLRTVGYQVSGFAGDAQIDLNFNILNSNQCQAFIFGSESEGMRRRIQLLCHQILRLPTIPPVNDLNVSSAAAICFFALCQARRL